MNDPQKMLIEMAAKNTWRDVALDMGLPASYLHDVAHGKRPPSDKLLGYLGLERVVTYRRKRKGS